MSPCLFPSSPSAPSPWALLSSLRTVLVLGPRGPALESRLQQLRRGGFTPAVTHSGEAALRRLAEDPIPSLILVHGAHDGGAHFLAHLRRGGLLGWFSLVLLDAGGDAAALPWGVQPQAQLPGDCSSAQLLSTLERLIG
jgi:hypothetical protein